MANVTFKKYQENAFEDLRSFCQNLLLNPARPQNAWEDFWIQQTKRPHTYSALYDPQNTTSIPNVCFHIPTGGGKTIMACEGLRIIQHTFLQKTTGLVLWLVPTDAIYKQTVKAFNDLNSPERSLLKFAGHNRIKLFEFRGNKRQVFTKQDVENFLCIVPMTIASFAQNKDLKANMDSGDFLSFIPPTTDVKAHQKLVESTPNLDCHSSDSFPVYAHQGIYFAKNSLENVFRLCKPVVILDEAHKVSKSDEKKLKKAMDYVTSFNPSFMLEITATPKSGSNRLFSASGLDLYNESMIKLPITVENIESKDWKPCVERAIAQQKLLEQQAQLLKNTEGVYIRPIVLITVERTGKDQKDPAFIHIDDVRSYLIAQGIPSEHIKYQTSEVKELDGEDLLRPKSQVRYILTKKALAEGWNCPFAYILCSVDRGTVASTALTQLLGRVLRQPNAKRYSNYPALNESYVYTLGDKAKETYDAIKKGLESEGFTDKEVNTLVKEADTLKKAKTKAKRQDQFKKEEIFLPYFSYIEKGKEPVKFSWETHLLPHVDYSKIILSSAAASANGKDIINKAVISLDEQSRPQESAQQEIYLSSMSGFDSLFITRQFRKWIPNAWIAYDILKPVFSLINSSDKPFDIIETLKTQVAKQIHEQCEGLFHDFVNEGRIRFSLITSNLSDSLHWKPLYELDVAETEPLTRENGQALQRALIAPVPADSLNEHEKEVAYYLDQNEAVLWWYKIIERQRDSYKLRGWEKRNIYPDFLVKKVSDTASTYLIYETKGTHLKGNDDTEYKNNLLKLLKNEYKVVGELKNHPGSMIAKIVIQETWRSEINKDLLDKEAVHL